MIDIDVRVRLNITCAGTLIALSEGGAIVQLRARKYPRGRRRSPSKMAVETRSTFPPV